MKFYTNFCLLRNKIYVRGYDNGKQFFEQNDYSPFLFLPNPDGNYVTLDGSKVKRIDFDSPREARDFAKKYADIENFEMHGFPGFDYVAISEWYPGKIQYDPSVVRSFLLDIEVQVGADSYGKPIQANRDEFPEPDLAKWPITAISVVYDNKCICFGLGKFDTQKMTEKYELPVVFKSYTNERDLLSSFMSFYNMMNPDIISGWNIEGFDIPYMVNRYRNVFGEDYIKKFSPYGKISTRKFVSKFGKEMETYLFEGIAILDYMLLYQKHTFTMQESYALNHIAFVELNETKLEYDGNLFDLYLENPQLFFEYNCKDSMLVHRLDKKLGLLNLIMNVSYFAKINFDDVASPVKTWDVIIANRLLESSKVVPYSTPHAIHIPYEGAFVKDPITGRYGWLISVDKNSMYPMLIRSGNVGPDTYVRQDKLNPELLDLRERVVLGGVPSLLNRSIDTSVLKKYNLSMTANGEFYTRDHEGILSILVGELYFGRKSDKTASLKAKAEVEKIKHELERRGVSY